MHTRAPWRINDMPLPSRRVIEIRDGRGVVAIVPNRSKGKAYSIRQVDAETQANARLISTAPILLEACKAMAEYISGQWESDWTNRPNHLRLAEQAIKKAEGEA